MSSSDKARRSLVVVAASAALLLPLTAVSAVADSTSADDRAERRTHDAVAREFTQRGADNQPFIGTDGVLYQPAPFAVPGHEDEFFYGPDFDTACGVGGRASRSMKRASKLARIIANSGRRVLWTAAPNKTHVLSRRIDMNTLPHGQCDAAGLAAQQQLVDEFGESDPHFIPMRRRLARNNRQVYFKTDPHWTTVGATVFTRAVAKELDPRVARRQKYGHGTEEKLGLLNVGRGVYTPEIAERAWPVGPAKVATAPDSVEEWTGYPATTLDHSWNTLPAKRTWPGDTLLLGDSFMLYALESMRPVFRHGRFMFVGHVNDRDVIRAIRQADTVVFEILQVFIAFDSIITSSKFRKKLRQALLGR